MAARLPRKDDFGKILQLSRDEKLSGPENYNSWTIHMRPVLYEAKCLSHVLPAPGEERELQPPAVPAAPRAQWNTRDQAGIVAIIANIQVSQHGYLPGNDTRAADLWDHFASLYRVQNGQYRGMATLKWQTARQHAKDSLNKHVENMMQLRTEMRNAGVIQDDLAELGQFLVSIDKSRYGTTVSNCYTWMNYIQAPGQPAQYTWANVLAALRTQEAGDEASNMIAKGDYVRKSENSERALFAQGNRKRDGRYAPGQNRNSQNSSRAPHKWMKAASAHNGAERSQQTCFYCRRKGHVSADCLTKARGQPPAPKDVNPSTWYRKLEASPNMQKREEMKCSRCHRNNHETKDCYANLNRRPFAGPSHPPHAARLTIKNDDEEDVGTLRAMVTEVGEGSGVRRESTPWTKDESVWLVDSACSAHITSDQSSLREYKKISKKKICWGNDGDYTYAVGKGSVHADLIQMDGTIVKVRFDNVYFVPDFGINLISVKKISADGVRVIFDQNGCDLIGPDGGVFGHASTVAGDARSMYALDMVIPAERVYHVSTAKPTNDVDVMTLHRNACHVGADSMRMLVPGLSPTDLALIRGCEACVAGKMTRRPFKSRPLTSAAKCPGEILSMDTCHIGKPSFSGCEKWLLIVDEVTKFLHVSPLKSKADASTEIQTFVVWSNGLGNRVRFLRSDNGTEFLNAKMDLFCAEQGIMRLLPTPYTPQQNGMAERNNRTVLEGVRTLLRDAKLPPRFWAEAANAYVYTRNLVPRSLHGKTPYENFCHVNPPPILKNPFGRNVIYWVRLEDRQSKLSPPGRRGRFLGPACIGRTESPGSFRVWDIVGRCVKSTRDMASPAPDTYSSPAFEVEFDPKDGPIGDHPEPEGTTRGESVVSRGTFPVLAGKYPMDYGEPEASARREATGAQLDAQNVFADRSAQPPEAGEGDLYGRPYEDPSRHSGSRGTSGVRQTLYNVQTTTSAGELPPIDDGAARKLPPSTVGDIATGTRSGIDGQRGRFPARIQGNLGDEENANKYSATRSRVTSGEDNSGATEGELDANGNLPTGTSTQTAASNQQTGRMMTSSRLSELLRKQIESAPRPFAERCGRTSQLSKISLPNPNSLVMTTARVTDADSWGGAEPTQRKRVRHNTPRENIDDDVIYACPVSDENNPTTIAEAKQRSDWPEWQKAMKTNLDNMMRLRVWEATPRIDIPDGRKPIEFKWVFVKKMKADGTLINTKRVR